MKNSLVVWIVLVAIIHQSGSHTQTTYPVSPLLIEKHYVEKELINDSNLSPQPRRKHGKYINRFMLDLFNILNEKSGENYTKPKRDLHPLKNQLGEDEINKAEISDDIISMFCINHQPDLVGKKQKLVFSTEEVSDNVRVIGAELRLYQKIVPTSTSYLLEVLQRTQNPQGGKKIKRVSQKTISANFTGWISIDVSQMFSGWLRNNSNTKTLYITAQRNENNEHPATLGIDFQNQDNKPFLLAFLKLNETNVNLPRYLLAPKTKHTSYNNITKKSQCVLRSTEVSFEELGWDEWVVAPVQFTMGFCEGSCDFPFKSPIQATNHGVMQSLMASMYPDKFPKPPCAPSKTSSMSVLMLVNHTTIVKNFRKMIVESCSCQ